MPSSTAATTSPPGTRTRGPRTLISPSPGVPVRYRADSDWAGWMGRLRSSTWPWSAVRMTGRPARRASSRTGFRYATWSTSQCDFVSLPTRVQHVVDRVEHDADDGVGVEDCVAHLGIEPLAGVGGQVALMEQPRLPVSPERGETGLLLGLAAGAELPGQQTGPGDRRDGGNGGEDGFAPVYVRVPPRATGRRR